MATLEKMVRQYVDTNTTVYDYNPTEVYMDGAQEILIPILNKIKAKYGYNKPFLYTDLLDTIKKFLEDG